MRAFGVTALSLVALTACAGAVVGGGSSGAGGSTTTDTTPDAAGDAAIDAGPGTCWICACETMNDDGGCRNSCDILSTTWPPGDVFFCQGMQATTMCKECIAQRCGASDPTLCK